LLAGADVSIAVGAGAPLATAGADAILTASSLAPLAKTLLLADKTQLIIKENLIWALVYNLLAIPAAMMGWVNPWIAGIGMSLSSLAVTLNAWRLRKA
jgi:Cu2+-exporting ATPase